MDLSAERDADRSPTWATGRSSRLVCIPTSDAVFNRFAVETRAAFDLDSPRRLTLQLRGLFPLVDVRPSLLQGARVWYAFRDGRASGGRQAAWWGARDVARVVLGEDGSVRRADRRSLDLFGGDARIRGLARIGGLTVESFVEPALRRDLRRLLEIVRTLEAPVLSTIRVRALDGGPLTLEYRAERRAGGIRLAFRPLDPAPAAPSAVLPICLPAWDRLFLALVERRAALVAPGPLPQQAAHIERRVREFYPEAVVQPAPELGFGRAVLACRDRRHGPFAPEGEAWWRDPRLPSVVVDGRAGTCVAAGGRTESLFGAPPPRLIGRRLADFSPAEARPDAMWLLAILDRLGETHSVITLEGPDGQARPVEFHAVKDAAGPGLHRVVFRPPTEA